MQIHEQTIEDGKIYSYSPEDSIYTGSQLKLIPNDQNENFENITLQSILHLLIDQFPENEIGLFIGDKIHFVDCGENFTKIYCPKCKSEMTAEEWQSFMSKASEKDFTDLGIVTSCCKHKTELNSLIYNENCGFAKVIFTIEGYEGNSVESLTESIKLKYNINLIPIFAKY
jgi:hypothetical protein